MNSIKNQPQFLTSAVSGCKLVPTARDLTTADFPKLAAVHSDSVLSEVTEARQEKDKVQEGMRAGSAQYWDLPREVDI